MTVEGIPFGVGLPSGHRVGDATIVRGPAALARLFRNGFLFLFVLLILSSAYDKSGLVVGQTSVTLYKALCVVLLLAYLLDPFRRRSTDGLVRRPLRWVIAFVVVQTLASLAGALATPEPWSASSELYYLIQRSSFLALPLFAWRYGLSPAHVLRLFTAGILVHYCFIVLQFVSPQTYVAFVRTVEDQLRPDNSLGWNQGSLVFIGLQRTGNYGAFAASFGLLFLPMIHGRAIWRRLAARAVVITAVSIALLAGSRAVFLMTLTALVVYALRTGHFRRVWSYFAATLVALAITALFLSGLLNRSSLGSVDAFFSEEREASTLGKISNARYGWQLFRQSPLVGFGQQRFAALTLPLGNENPSQSESHSQVLSTVLSSGLVGFLAYVWAFAAITREVWRQPGRDAAIVCSLFIGLNLYNIIYDAGALDVFACFNGLAAYYALYGRGDTAPDWRRLVDRDHSS